ncbi:MAG: tetratricopeptide repeat protein [Planctomycetaceae bacterium]|nr:tetratricopeptide repeat protein [Planctomycetaceae bacterium]
MVVNRFAGICLIVTGVSLFAGTASRGDDVRPPAPSRPVKVSPLEGLQLQIGDEPLQTFEPVRPLKPGTNDKRRALALYMEGQLHQRRDDTDKALASYLRAIEADPTVIDSYQAAVPLLLLTRKEEEAHALALRSTLHTEDGFALVEVLAATYVRDNKIEPATELLRGALASRTLKRNSVIEYVLRRDLGGFLRLSEQYEDAAAEYKILFDALLAQKLNEEDRAKLIPDAGALFDEFGDTFLKADQPELALQAYEEASKYRESKPGIHSFNLATIFQQTKQPEKALEELERYLTAQLQTRGRLAYQLLKDLLHELGRDDELFGRLEQLHKDDPHNETLTFFLADELVDADRLDEAEAIYLGDQNAQNINDPRAIVGMMSIYRRRGDVENLLPALTKTFQLIPRDDGKRDALNNVTEDVRALAERFEQQLTELKEDEPVLTDLFAYARGQAEGNDAKLDFVQAYILGKLAAEADRSEEAVEFYQLAVSMRNSPPDVLYWELGSHLVDAKKYELAIEVLNDALAHPAQSLQSAHWKFQFLQSYAYEYLGKTDEALNVIREAQMQMPDMPLMFYQEGWVVYHRQRWDEALVLFQGVIEKFPDEKKMTLDCQFLMSNIYVKQGDMPKGEQVLLDILKENPEHPQANNDLGYLWADQNKNLEKAREMISIALEAEPDNAAYQDSMGWVLYRVGEFQEAFEYLHKATQTERGEDSTLFEHLGDCLVKLNRGDEAKDIYKKALEFEEEKELPDSELVERLKEKLK